MIPKHLQGQVLTKELFTKYFDMLNRHTKKYITGKFPYVSLHSRKSGLHIDDILHEGLIKLHQTVDFENFILNGKNITIRNFTGLYYQACKQVMIAYETKMISRKKGVITKMNIECIEVTSSDGEEYMLPEVEEKLSVTDNHFNLSLNFRHLIIKCIDECEKENDKLFFRRLHAHLMIEKMIRKQTKKHGFFTKKIQLDDVIDLFSDYFEKKYNYIQFKTTVYNDKRLKLLKRKIQKEIKVV
jgi:hypothetical protein